MTTKFLDNKFFQFQNFIVMTFPMKNSVLDNFPPCPPAQAPLKSANFIFIVVSILVAFHPLAIWVATHPQLQPAPKSQPIPEWERNFSLWLAILKSQPASTRCDLRIASPTRPFLQVI